MKSTLMLTALLFTFSTTSAPAQMPLPSPEIGENDAAQHAIIIETFRFYDWDIAISPRNQQGLQCHITLQGVSRHRLTVSMRLSMVEPEPLPPQPQISQKPLSTLRATQDETKTLTVLKVAAQKGPPSAPEQALHINDAWLETTQASTLGVINKADADTRNFLGGAQGLDLFLSILKGIKEEGLIIGIRVRGESRARLFKAPPPKAEVFRKLRPCFEKRNRGKMSQPSPIPKDKRSRR